MLGNKRNFSQNENDDCSENTITQNSQGNIDGAILRQLYIQGLQNSSDDEIILIFNSLIEKINIGKQSELLFNKIFNNFNNQQIKTEAINEVSLFNNDSDNLNNLMIQNEDYCNKMNKDTNNSNLPCNQQINNMNDNFNNFDKYKAYNNSKIFNIRKVNQIKAIDILNSANSSNIENSTLFDSSLEKSQISEITKSFTNQKVLNKLDIDLNKYNAAYINLQKNEFKKFERIIKEKVRNTDYSVEIEENNKIMNKLPVKRRPIMVEMEKELYEWYTNNIIENNYKYSDEDIKHKAICLANKRKFKASLEWLRGFKRRNNIE